MGSLGFRAPRPPFPTGVLAPVVGHGQLVGSENGPEGPLAHHVSVEQKSLTAAAGPGP